MMDLQINVRSKRQLACVPARALSLQYTLYTSSTAAFLFILLSNA
jgi:hypothetical protein